jgi:hypothetical protein
VRFPGWGHDQGIHVLEGVQAACKQRPAGHDIDSEPVAALDNPARILLPDAHRAREQVIIPGHVFNQQMLKN